MGHQVVERDRPLGRNGVVQRAADVGHHPHLGQLRQPLGDRIGQREPAFVDEGHRRGDGDRLGHGCNAEHRVALHRQARLDVAVAEFVDLQYLAGLPYQRDRPGEQARVDRLVYGCTVAVEIHRRQRTQPRRKHFGRDFGRRLYAAYAAKTTLESVANSDAWQLTGIGRTVIQRRSVARIEREVLR